MDPFQHFINIMKKTSVVKAPKHRLSTFGETRIQYFFLSEVHGFKDRSRLRNGLVIAEKPKIITPDFLKNRFEGFGKETEMFGKWLLDNYGGGFRALEYKFRNESSSVRVEHNSVKSLSDEIKNRLEQEGLDQAVVMRGPDSVWQIALMKFIIDECTASFSVNLRDLQEHGFFDSPEDLIKERKKIVEGLFTRAKNDHTYVPVLGQKLNDFGLFKEYEDEFFRLFKH